ncbi:fimbrial protein, partial [Escherichia coli]
FDKPFMEQAGLKVPSDYELGCYDYTGHIPSAIVEASPAQESLSLVVPADRIANSESDIGAYTSGGTAALLNYSLLSSRNEFGDGHSDYSQAMLDGGVNFDDWILRTQQLLSRSDGEF